MLEYFILLCLCMHQYTNTNSLYVKSYLAINWILIYVIG